MNDKTPAAHLMKGRKIRLDSQLVAAAQGGDKKAFVEIVARYQVTVSAVTLAIMKDFGASEDAAQETFLTAWKKIQNIREPAKLRAWLAGIARLTAFKHLRRQKPEQPLDAVVLQTADDAQRPDELVADGDELALVLSALEKLPENYRVPLVLYYREDHSVRAVAEALALTEAAVRKRLARGREMLRNEMRGVVDSVLRRTVPTTVFTVTVAASIGALTSRSAVAAMVTSGTTVTQTSLATTTTTIMTSKLTLTTTIAMAAISMTAGYQVRVATEPEPQNPVAISSMVLPDPIVQKDRAVPVLPNSALIAEWKRLHDEHGSGAAAMPLIYTAIGKMPDTFSRRALRAALAAEWAEISPKNGLMFYGLQTGRGWQLDLFINEWVKRDGWEAIDVLSNIPDWKDGARLRIVELTELLLPRITERDPSELAELMDQIPKAKSSTDSRIRDAIILLAAHDLEYARATAELLKGPNREEALAGIARIWAESDGSEALEWAQTKLEGEAREEVIRNVLIGWAKSAPVAALERVSTVPTAGAYPVSTAGRVLQAAAAADFETTVSWLRQNIGKIGQNDLRALGEAIRPRIVAAPSGFLSEIETENSWDVMTPGLLMALSNDASIINDQVWEWLKGKESSREIDHLRRTVFWTIADEEPVAAFKLLSETPASVRGDNFIENSVSGFLGYRRPLHRLDRVLPVASPEIRQALLERGFQLLNAENLVDPGVWVERVQQMKGDSKEDAISTLTKSWVDLDPIAATAWLTTLSDPSQSLNGHREAAEQWAKSDLHGAVEWVGQLSEGERRTHSIIGLVEGIQKADPEGAWKWAEKIKDDELRYEIIEDLVTPLITRDPERARTILEGASLPQPDKNRIGKLFQ